MIVSCLGIVRVHVHGQSSMAEMTDLLRNRVRSFFNRETHIGHVSRHPLRSEKDIEIHTWDGPDDLDNPYVIRKFPLKGQIMWRPLY